MSSSDPHHDHGHSHRAPSEISAALAQRVDPTGTTVLRERRFKPALTTRYRGVRGAVLQTIERNDALGLTTRNSWSGSGSAALAQDDISPKYRFYGRDDSEREAAFLRWFRGALRDGVLEPMSDRRIRNGEHYSAEFIEEAYRKGIRDGAAQLRAAGEQAPEEGSGAVVAAVSAVTLAALYYRTYRAIRGTLTTAERDVARVFSDHYPYVGKSTLRKEVNTAIADGGEDDAISVAKSEPIYAYAEGKLDQFEHLGVERIGLDPEVNLSTAGDSRVCERCRRVARQGPYSITKIRRNPSKLHPPLHPECRCDLVFVVSG